MWVTFLTVSCALFVLVVWGLIAVIWTGSC